MKKLAVLATLISLGAARAQVQVTSPLVVEHTASPNTTLEGSLTLSNTGAAPVQTQLSLGDVRSDAKAGTAYLKPGALERSNTDWIKFSSTLVTVPAKGKVTVPYRIQVPRNAAPGSHWGVVFVTPVTGSGAAAPTRPNSLSLQQVTRYAVQVVVQVPGGQSQLKFQDPQLGRSGSGMQLNVTLSNTGTRLAVPTTRAEIYDASGKLVQKIAGRPRRVYPGMSVLETYAITGLPAGKYQILVLADDKNAELVGARYAFTVN
ncbi:hypothetical protein [Deinococcus multiflagellatus]|uniref:P pilus assembly protein, chaperone PapD n=1 Tax=Deinococcus multiflagellatus TaxID=1656887 RepID=A0ABW1ZKB8_9DEIO|nr:hypothetical protein [Deinococcus multiflagellatus]MBZ9714251.1 hypothetical protein [Deinococcus multiflagellatus]